MDTEHTPHTPEQSEPQEAPLPATPVAPAPVAPTPPTTPTTSTRTRSERIWMYVGISSLSLLLLGGAVVTGALVSSANDDRADRVQINTNGRSNDWHDDRHDSRSGKSDSAQPKGNSQATPKNRSRSIDIDNNGAVPLDDATITAISKAALAAVNGPGVVTDIENEQGDNKTYAYEVEIERADRSEVTVYLDKSYKVLKTVEDETWD